MRQIPKTFPSEAHYLNSFVSPLIEETRTELQSSIKMVSEAPAWEIINIDYSKGYNPPNDLLYKIEINTTFDKNGDIFEPEPGQLIALTDRRPTCIHDLSKPGSSFIIASIRRVRKYENTEDVYEIQILTSKPIQLEEYLQLQKDDRYICVFAVYLGNLTTHIRIWNALNSDPDGPNMHIVRQLLQPNSAVRTTTYYLFLL